MNTHITHAKAKLSFLFLTIFCVLQNVSAQNDLVQTNEQNAQQQQWLGTLRDEHLTESHSSTSSESSPQPRVLTEAMLRENPPILAQFLTQALNTQQYDLIENLVDNYRQTPQADARLLARADGMVLRSKGQLRQAMTIYEQLTHDAPDDVRVRLDWAAMQFENKQWRDARENFAIAQQQENLPDAVGQNIRRFEQAIDAQTQWQGNAGISPVRNNNVNDAAPPHCLLNGLYCSNERAERSVGLAYDLGASKLWAQRGNSAWIVRGTASGTSYLWDKKSQYDYAFARIYGGWQWQDARQKWAILPFYQAQLGGSHYFADAVKSHKNRRLLPYLLAHGVGAQINFSRQWATRWQSYHSLESYDVNYREAARAERQNGRQDSVYSSLAFRVLPRTTVFLGHQFSRLSPKNKTIVGHVNNAAWHRNAISVGWLQAWGHSGLNSRVVYTGAHRNYAGVAALSRENQRNREKTVQAALSHHRLKIWGIMPTLNLQYSRTNSNQAWAKRNNNQIFIGIEKGF